MSKTMEQASLTSRSPGWRVGQVISGLIATLLGAVLIVVGIIGYGVYSQGSRANSRMASSADSAPPTPVEQAQSLDGAIVQPVRASQTLPVSTVPPSSEPSPAETQTESKHADIYFDFGKSRLRADATAILQQHADALKKDGNWAVLIQGYADQHGPTEYNRTLALRRGESVKQFLVELGVPESSMKVVSLGKDSAICDGQSRTCQRLNRRVHVEMVKLEMEPVSPVPTTTEAAADLTQVSDETPMKSEGQAIEEPVTDPTGQP